MRTRNDRVTTIEAFERERVAGRPDVTSLPIPERLRLYLRFARYLGSRRDMRASARVRRMIDYAQWLRQPTPIVWIASASKSGNTWLRYLLHHILFGDVTRAGEPERAIPHWLGLFERLHDGTLRRTPGRGYVLLKTHALPHDALSWRPFFTPFTAGAVYLYRNPKDVCLSQINHVRLVGQFREADDVTLAYKFLTGELFPYEGPWPAHVAAWRRVTEFPVLIVSYERLRSTTADTLQSVLEFIGEPVNRDRVTAAIAGCDLASMRALEDAQGTALGYRTARGDASLRFVNGGLSNQSLERFGAPFVAAFERHHAQAMREMGYVASGPAPLLGFGRRRCREPQRPDDLAGRDRRSAQ